MLNKYKLVMPNTVYSGENALENLTQVINRCSFRNIVIFSDKGIRNAGLIDIVIPYLEATDAEYTIIDEIPAEPSYLEVQRFIDQCNSRNVDFIIGIGGGSVMDSAKLASLLVGDDHSAKDLLSTPGCAKKRIRSMMIPTTAGTGAEATPNAIVYVPEELMKIGIVNEAMIPEFVILDSRMIRNLPRSIAAATGIDALCHAIECYTSNKANPFSDFFAMEALALIFSNIEKACDEADALAAKECMQIASFYAGVSITASGTTAVHALSYPLGGKYHIPHGVSNAMLLMPVMKFNEDAIREKLAEVYDRCFTVPLVSVEEKSRAVISRIDEIVKHLDIPQDLSGYGVGKEDLEDLVKAGLGVTRLLNNNMKKVDEKAARDIYMQIL